jgi:hypothetical protein
MTTHQLEQAFKEASKLPEDDQRTLAQWILLELESERRWSELFSQSGEALSSLAQEALAEHSAGKTKELDPERI